MIAQLAIAGATVAIVGVSAFFYGQKLEAEGWIEVVAEQNVELQALKDESAARVKRDAESSKRASAKRVVDAKQQEIDRAKWIAGARAEWVAHLESERLRGDALPAESDAARALSACRSERDATRAGLERVITTGERAAAACANDRLQLGALLGWLNEVTR